MSETETTQTSVEIIGEVSSPNYGMLLHDVIRLSAECRHIITEVNTVEEFGARLEESGFTLTDHVVQELYDAFTHEITFPKLSDRPFPKLPDPVSYIELCSGETYNTGRQSCAYGIKPNERHRDLLSAKGRKFL